MPPPKKRTVRASIPHPLPESDTDGALLTDINPGPALPPPPARTVEEMNHAVLRRYIPNLQHIISKAPFAVLYTFSPESGSWEKVGCEGCLFVCQLAADSGAGPGTRWKLIILNRKGMENFTTELVSADDIEVTEEYVILQSSNADGEPVIHGIWIFDDVDENGQKTGRREMVCREIVGAAMRAQIAHEQDGTRQEEGGADGEEQMEEQTREEEVVSRQVGQGQPLDVMQLFGSMKPKQEVQSPPPPAETRFTPMPDTEFFRTAGTPPIAQQYQQQRPPPSQQNLLLNLFKK